MIIEALREAMLAMLLLALRWLAPICAVTLVAVVTTIYLLLILGAAYLVGLLAMELAAILSPTTC